MAHSPLTRLPLMLPALLSLLIGLQAGLLRLGWVFGPVRPELPLLHGPLMVAGFLGTLIGLERAVAVGRPWAWLAPAGTAAGGLGLLLGVLEVQVAAALFVAGALGLVAIFARLLRQQPNLPMGTMAFATLLWLAGHLLWLSGAPLPRVVLWWAGFLVLTIAGERLELSRLLMPTRNAQRLFGVLCLLLVVGVGLRAAGEPQGTRVFGASLLGLALWLWRHDLARRTVRQPGQRRFIASAILAGHLWLGVAGVVGLAYGESLAGPSYDALLHGIFLGFAISMVMGHAPIVFPAVSGRPIAWTRLAWLPLGLLHGSLLLRIGAELLAWWPGRRLGGLLNAVAILLFLLVTVGSIIAARKQAHA